MMGSHPPLAPHQEAGMKKLCSLLLLLFVSAASAAEPGGSLKNTLPSIHHSKFSVKLIHEGIGDVWDKQNLRYRFSSQFDFGLVRGLAGNGVGIEYALKSKVTLFGVVYRSRYVRAKFLLVGVKIVF